MSGKQQHKKKPTPGKGRIHDGEAFNDEGITCLVWGIQIHLDAKTFGDYEFLEAVKKGDEGDPLALVTLVDAIAGSPEKLKEIKQTVRRVKGDLSAESMASFVEAFFTRMHKLAPNH